MHQSQLQVLHPGPVSGRACAPGASAPARRLPAAVFMIQHPHEPLRGVTRYSTGVSQRSCTRIDWRRRLACRAAAPCALPGGLLTAVRASAAAGPADTPQACSVMRPWWSMRLDQRQVVGVPPGHVGLVAEGAAHHRAGALFRVGGRVCQDRHRLPEERHTHRRPARSA